MSMQEPMRIYHSGAELAARRKAAGLKQHELAQRAGCGRSAVQYWERRSRIDPTSWAVARMAQALGWVLRARTAVQYAHARGRGLTRDIAEADALAAAMFEEWKAREAQRATTRRVICGARNRKGAPCRCKSEPGKRRCKFHGGRSTGPKTPEGKARIAQAQRQRWDAWRRVQHLGEVQPRESADHGKGKTYFLVTDMSPERSNPSHEKVC
ncbi:helix-turn-helix domain-containing protein [Paracoccus thiocyanatus]|uniref:HTH cro/C1-type domain-containing protein n=1 Tax=Paracoccus thiocyanatus TaxID=34006 RepID=A0A3D8PAM2_9RHOB|nr:helix-turn-helix transcriptional regulator [Paracoccus thiocyanatus]RDW13113.1 hypothetical protein DIE28_09975 [Paracoccus thiocyanatus]